MEIDFFRSQLEIMAIFKKLKNTKIKYLLQNYITLQTDPSESINLYEKYPLIAQECLRRAIHEINLLENN